MLAQWPSQGRIQPITGMDATALRPILERDPKAGPTRPSYVEPISPAPTVLPKAE